MIDAVAMLMVLMTVGVVVMGASALSGSVLGTAAGAVIAWHAVFGASVLYLDSS